MMNKKICSLLLVLTLTLASCAGKKKIVDDDFGVEDEAGTELTLDDGSEQVSNATEKDEFSDFDKSAQADTPAEPPAETPAPAETSPPVAETPAPELPEIPPQQPQEVAAPEPPPPAPTQTARISDVKFLANDSGGTLVITADNPLQYKTRMNSNTNQLVVEVENAIVPDRLKRPLITKDMTSNIGSIDIYQNPKSNIARFVVQLRSGATEPLVQPEGNSLLVVGTPSGVSDEPSQPAQASESTSSEDASASNLSLMSTDSLEDFLANNNKFYGRKISIETTDMDVRDVLKFISEEAGINMIFDDNVQGRISLKLRKIPWDQALVTLLKAKKLAYRRQGDVLRIAVNQTLAEEEEYAIRLKEAKSKFEPLVVKNFSINYADVTALEAKIKDFISDGGGTQTAAPAGGAGGAGAAPGMRSSEGGRGKVTADARTNSLIVTETASKLIQVEKLVKLLDAQPQQVLIEGRVVEASETYARTIGVNFGFNLAETGDANLVIPTRDRVITTFGRTGDMSRYYSPSMTFNPQATGSFTGSLWTGQFGAFGDLSMRLALDEVEEKVKILSSPRIAVLHNTAANISQGSVIQVPSTETSTAGTTTVTQTFKEVEVGVNLEVKPLISSIGTVNLGLKIERSAVTPTGGRTQRSAETNIIVKSGETAVIGGVFTSDQTNRRTGIPGLKDIPVLGTLFRTDSTSNQKTELMFFISPRILKTLESPTFKASNQDMDGQN